MPVIDWLSGNCPVQAEGTIDGVPFYFRARGCRWSLSVGGDPLDDFAWYYEEPYGETYEAGWMSEPEAVSFIERGAQLWRQSLKAPPS